MVMKLRFHFARKLSMYPTLNLFDSLLFLKVHIVVPLDVLKINLLSVFMLSGRDMLPGVSTLL